jgi:hypothetical protein
VYVKLTDVLADLTVLSASYVSWNLFVVETSSNLWIQDLLYWMNQWLRNEHTALESLDGFPKIDEKTNLILIIVPKWDPYWCSASARPIEQRQISLNSEEERSFCWLTLPVRSTRILDRVGNSVASEEESESRKTLSIILLYMKNKKEYAKLTQTAIDSIMHIFTVTSERK